MFCSLKKKKRSDNMKKTIKWVLGLLIIALIGYFGVRMAVNYVFDNYFIDYVAKSYETAEKDPDKEETKTEEKEEQAEKPEQSTGSLPVSETTTPPKKEMSTTEIIVAVSKNPELTKIAAAMVPYETKRKVIKILMSNFTADELADFAKQAAGGYTKEFKSKMIGIARSRLTSEQWMECVALGREYAEKMRPYVE